MICSLRRPNDKNRTLTAQRPPSHVLVNLKSDSPISPSCSEALLDSGRAAAHSEAHYCFAILHALSRLAVRRRHVTLHAVARFVLLWIPPLSLKERVVLGELLPQKQSTQLCSRTKHVGAARRYLAS